MKRNNPRRAGAVGAEYSRLAGELYKAQSSATAPNTHPDDQPYQPRRIGEIVALSGLAGRYEVTCLNDSSLVTVRAENGATVRVGWRMVRRVEQ